jgi:hypothetical protein
MIEDGEIVHHAAYGTCRVNQVCYRTGKFQGAYLVPLNQMDLERLKLASLSDNPVFLETEKRLISGA